MAIKQRIKHRESPQEYFDRLDGKNISLVGKGKYGRVFQHPKHPNVVAKVTELGFQNQKYLKWCAKHPSNPYAPRVYSIHDVDLVSSNDETYFIAFLEKLEPIKVKQLRAFISENCPKAIVPVGSTKWRIAAKGIPHVNDRYLRSILSALARMGNITLWDLHTANFMRRGNQIVFTDPIQ